MLMLAVCLKTFPEDIIINLLSRTGPEFFFADEVEEGAMAMELFNK